MSVSSSLLPSPHHWHCNILLRCVLTPITYDLDTDHRSTLAVLYTVLHAENETIKYTVSHKKRSTLFLIITLAFLGRFLYFLHQWKKEGILYTQVKTIYYFTLTVSTLPGKTKTTYKQHILKSIIAVRSFEPVVSNLRRNLSNVLFFQFLVENSFISHIPTSF